MLEPNPPRQQALGRRIRLRGLLRKSPALAGLFYSPLDARASPVHHEIADKHVGVPDTEGYLWAKALG